MVGWRLVMLSMVLDSNPSVAILRLPFCVRWLFPFQLSPVFARICEIIHERKRENKISLQGFIVQNWYVKFKTENKKERKIVKANLNTSSAKLP